MPRRVYLDHSATTPLRPQVREAMQPYLSERYGNPSSVHAFGREAREAVEDARHHLMSALGSGRDHRLIFTGSGSEADNLAVLGFARRAPGGRVIRSSIEHKAVLEATRALEREGYEVREAPVASDGAVDLDALARLLDGGGPTLVSVMWANNETGVVQPLREISALCRERGALLHSDAVQAFGKLPLDLDAVPVDLLAISAHKLGGPKGVGALLSRNTIELEPLVYGGGQEHGIRSGTLDVAGIVGFSRAAELATTELPAAGPVWQALRDRLEAGLQKELPEIVVNGAEAAARLPHVSNVSVPGVDLEGLLTALDLEGICVSSGSACTTGSIEPSHVLRAMGREGGLANNTVRLSLGWGTSEDDIDHVLGQFPRVVRRVREFATPA